MIVSSPSSLFWIERNGGYQDKLCNFLLIIQVLFVSLNLSPARVHPPISSSLPSSSNFFSTSFLSSSLLSKPHLLFWCLAKLSSLIQCFFCNSSATKSWADLIIPNIVVMSRADKCRESKVQFNHNMFQLLLVGGNTNLSPPWDICYASYSNLYSGNGEYT